MLRTLRLEGGELDLLGVLNDNTADGRDVSWVWDADWELLAGSVRRMTCAGTRAAELALRMKYAGVPGERLHVVPELPAALDAARADGSGPLYALPDLHRAAGAARPALRARPRHGALAMSWSPLVVWHDVECGRYDADLPLWRELAAAEGGPVLDVGAGTGRVALDLARAGFPVVALDREPELLAALEERAGRARRAHGGGRRGRRSRLDAAFPLIIVPMQTIQLLPERAGFFAAAAAHLAPGGLLAIAITEAIEDFDGGRGHPPHARRRPSSAPTASPPSRPPCARSRPRRGSSACGARSGRTGSPRRRTT